MKNSMRRQQRATILRLAIVLALLVSASCDRSPTAVNEQEQICYLIDGQVYCIP